MSDTIADGKVVTIQYTLTVDGETIDASPEDQPFMYLHGHGNIVPGLESALAGKPTGHEAAVAVAPQDGYGERHEDRVQAAPRSAFPPEMKLEPGMQLFTKDDQENPVPLWIQEITDETVKVDFNHPLAGETLEFAVRVLEIRDASSEELEHGHPHGPGGHEH